MNPNSRNVLAAMLLSVALAATSSCNSNKSYSSSVPTGPAAGELDSGDFGPGGTYQHRFAAAGIYGYHCVHHSPMTGSVQVSTTAADTVANVSIVSASVPFPAASVKPGGRVIWTNNSGMVHTVTSN